MISHTYNGGVDPLDGTFKLPDFREKLPVGAGGTKTLGSNIATTNRIAASDLAAHSHGITDPTHGHTVYTGTAGANYYWPALTLGGTNGSAPGSMAPNGAAVASTGVTVNNSASATTTYYPPYQTVNYIVKY